MLPSHDVKIAICEGPFEDDNGVGRHFEKEAYTASPKQAGYLKRDMHTSVIKLARHAALHKPQLIWSQGTGSIVAAGYSKPGMMEDCMASRNIQIVEIPEITRAWAGVLGIVLQTPRLSKIDVQLKTIGYCRKL